MIKNSGSVDEKRGRFYPLAEWSKSDVLEYIRKNKLRISDESNILGFSFRSFDKETLKAVKAHFPADFEKIKAQFPFCEAEMLRGEDIGKE